MFTAGETEHPLTGQPAATLAGVAITHGEVLRAHGDAGVAFEGDRGRRVVGTVVDSLGVGLPNARVYVQGSGTETETDAEGRFELDHLGVGTYALHATHPYLEQLWYEPEPEASALRQGQRSEHHQRRRTAEPLDGKEQLVRLLQGVLACLP